MIGASLHQYRITARLGAGGMGEVFRARDTRLGRDVAVKVLPPDFARDADRLRRFEQEAKTLAALNHPNVLTVFDAGTHAGAPYLVSELLEGRTLREELAAGAMPVRKAADYALQIAQGLAAAHGRGIVHRDIKPENLFVTPDGRVKILDFGLARRAEPPPGPVPPGGGAADPAAPTVAEERTRPGQVMGTPGYMAPEQVRGEAADHRADLFAFGCVLYEMLVGQRAFRRDTAVESMNAILKEEPADPLALRPELPPPLVRIVQRCLEKAPDNRFQSAKDLAFALEAFGGTTTTSSIIGRTPSGNAPRLVIAAVATTLVIGALLLLWQFWSAKPLPGVTAPTWLEITSPGRPFPHNPSPASSPDGRQVAFYAPVGDGQLGLWIKSLDAPAPRLLPGTILGSIQDGGHAPAWSPDGRSLALLQGRQLLRVELAGGQPQV
ncbi:MAG TPA: protein kinase, partial [Verrucomicrobiota bacterium]|nr:protein kinase [Verrucomicrobiota bacterium]